MYYCIYWKSEKVSLTYSLTDNFKSRDASASKKSIAFIPASHIFNAHVGLNLEAWQNQSCLTSVQTKWSVFDDGLADFLSRDQK